MITKNINNQSLSADFVTALTSDGTTWTARLLDNGTELDCTINRITVTKGACGSEDGFTIGSVVGSTLVAQVAYLTTPVKGKEIEAQVGILINGSYEYISLGKFIVSEAPQNAYTTTITAYGKAITRTGDAFSPPSTMTLANIASSIATSISTLHGSAVTVSFATGIDTTKTITQSMVGLTVYQALEVLASVCGGYATDTSDGNIKIYRFDDTPTLTRTTDTMKVLPVVEESDFQILGTLVVVSPEYEDDDGTVVPAVTFPATPTGTENLILENQYMTQALYTANIDTLTGYEYRPADVNFIYGDPRLEADDVLQVTDINSNVYVIPCHMLTHTFAGGLYTHVTSCSATPQENDVSSSAGSLTETLSSISASAISARASAESAQASAQYASAIVSDMEDYATQAGKTLVQILDDGETAGAMASQAIADATSAKNSAQSASEYASRALGNLATVQSVAETLTWITAHGTMTLTSDVALDPTHVYFVVDAGGDYTVGGTTYAIVTEPDVADIGTYYELSIDESLNNYVGTHLALDGEGLWLLPASSGTNKVLIATGAGSTYTTAGTYLIDSVGTTVASFRADGATLGEDAEGKTRTNIEASGMTIIRKDDNTDYQIAHIGYGTVYKSDGTTDNGPYYTLGTRTGNIGEKSVAEGGGVNASAAYSHAEGYTTDATALCAHAEGWFTNATGRNSHAEGDTTNATNDCSHAEGWYSTASGQYSHAEGSSTEASGDKSHAEGDDTEATSIADHAEGSRTHATGGYSHAEGSNTTASNTGAHAEGGSTTASGTYSHAEGGSTIASAYYSHAQNRGTHADQQAQTALGSYNIVDTSATTTHPSGVNAYGKYAVIVGNGTADNARSNALTVDWAGNVDIASGAKYKINGSDLSASDVGALPSSTPIPSSTSDLVNDSGFISTSNITVTDGTEATETTATQTWVGGAYVSLAPGKYIVFGHAEFASNSTGRRAIELYFNTTALDNTFVNQPTTSGTATQMQTAYMVTVNTTSTVTVYTWQNAGSLSVTTNIRAVRIA